MFELEYLYSRLKYETVKESFVAALNSVYESTYDEVGAKEDVHSTLKNIDEALMKKKLKLFDKRRKGVVTAKKLLSKFKATSEAAKPYGLNHEDFKTFKSDEEIKKMHETAIAYLNQFNPRTASDTEVKLFISDIEDNKQYNGLCTIFGEKCSTKENVVCKKETKELSKEDIKEAVSYLENFSDDYKKYDIVREAYDTYGLSRERKAAANYKSALMAVADAKYYELMSQKVTLEFAQAAQVVTKASYHNPRNLKESKEIHEYIDFLYKYEL